MEFLFSEFISPNSLVGQEPSLMEVLNSREKKQFLQQECLKKYSCSLLSISLISPGGVKKNLLQEYLFFRALETVDSYLLEEKITIHERLIKDEDTGLYALISLDEDPMELKLRMIKLEESLPLARLWDLDVLDKQGNIISRKQTQQAELRKCLLCEQKAKICARKRLHSIDEIYKRIQQLVIEDFLSQKVSEMAYQSMFEEINLTPKPGLVDAENSGSHRDMNQQTFLKSAEAIKPFFASFTLMGIHNSHESPELVFKNIRSLGLQAEKAMFSATSNINTHKGTIFSLGLVATAVGYLYKNQRKINSDSIGEFVINATAGILEEFYGMEDREESIGIQLFKKYHLTGARGEAAEGFKTVRMNSLPVLYRYPRLNKEHRLLLALLKLISVNNDTNVVHRGGLEALEWMKNYAQNLLQDMLIYEDFNFLEKQMKIFDKLCIEKNLSPGGSADLLALTWFFFELENNFLK
ncbi:triphosphoribosyl-dephospho-CoA synthase CitG [Apibacter muscae]|uniref:triphosphoribosyl-dephospho-CoA synthase CitG n=1 Tax=Apibacter muscae TaxID=2509004 RepID=UPI0011ADDC2F|nr:triphosphoribosyl-dephospho-CoA synthase CitG [Apibacter muscae]TWP30084.1 triphosphoribosyl-dephospho-CoA synthase CitG [Apibacter muscae]